VFKETPAEELTEANTHIQDGTAQKSKQLQNDKPTGLPFAASGSIT